MSIRIPGLEGIDIDEILGRASTIPRPPLNKKRPKPKPVVAAQPSPKELPPVFKGAGRGNAPRVINIPGLGSIEMPNAQSGGMEDSPISGDIFSDPRNIPFVPYEDDPFAGYRDREDDDDEDTPPVDFQSPSEYLSEQEMENITTPNPSLSEDQLRVLYTTGLMDFDDDFFTDVKGIFGEPGQRYGLGVNQDRIDEIAGEINFSSNQPNTEEESPPPKPPPPKPPPSFEGYVPRNILGASFDPKDVSAQQKMVADARARQTPGANIQGGGYLTYDNPILGNKQTQFGGYGQPMPTKPLMDYAGLSSPITYSVPDPDPDKEPGGPPPPPPVIT